MDKCYSFEFPGTKAIFLCLLDEYPNSKHKEFYFDDYLIEISGDEIRFGVARGGHSGGYWFIPTITEVDDKTIFCGTIQYIGPYANEKGIRKVISKVEEFLLEVLLLPIIIIVKVYQLFSWAIQKATGRTKSKEESLEDKLYDLMENHLNCQRQNCD